MIYPNGLTRLSITQFIIAICFLSWSCCALAREETGEMIENAKGITINEKTYNEQHTQPTNENNERSFKTAFPIRIITDPAETQTTSTREKEREEREKSNLDATWKSANATEYSAIIALGAVFFNLIGLFFLGWTLLETRRTAKASVKSADAASGAANIAKDAFNASEKSAAESAEKIRQALNAAQTTIEQFKKIAQANTALVQQATRSADAAQRALEIAEGNLKIARQTLVVTDRAWLRIECIAHHATVDSSGVKMSGTFNIKNIGNKPAINISIKIGIYKGVWSNLNFTDAAEQKIKMWAGKENSQAILFPSQFIDERFDVKISHDDIFEIIQENDAFNTENGVPAINIIVGYKLTGDETPRHTLSMFNFKKSCGEILELNGTYNGNSVMHTGKLVRHGPADHVT